MHTQALKSDNAPPTMYDEMVDIGFTPEQASVFERAYANRYNFRPSYWRKQFMEHGFTEEQADILIDMFHRYC